MHAYWLIGLLIVLRFVAPMSLAAAADGAGTTVWKFDRLDRIGGHAATVLGSPRVVRDGGPAAIAFDGVDDGLLLDVHPLAGARQFTVEVVFRPEAGGRPEQRFFHMQENASDDRVMLETRLVGKEQWFLDTFVKSGDQERTLYAETFLHPIGPWYHAALVVDGRQMRHYVNGKLELTADLDYRPQRAGRTSVGVRLNQVYWYRGAIREARFTRRPLRPAEFRCPLPAVRP